MSRYRKVQISRSKAIVVAAAGALSVATAASATATTWSSQASGSAGPAARSAHPAARSTHPATGAPRLSVTSQLVQLRADAPAEQASVTPAHEASLLRVAQARDAMAQWLAAQRQAAAQAVQRQAAQRQAAAQAARKAATARAAARPAQPAGTVAAAFHGTPQQIARAMVRSFGWSPRQFSCLQPLWAHESGWSVSAHNPGSGAYGIPQALPGFKMASAGPDWQTNAATQIRWGLRYIKSSYGSPCGALGHEQATGWY